MGKYATPTGSVEVSNKMLPFTQVEFTEKINFSLISDTIRKRLLKTIRLGVLTKWQGIEVNLLEVLAVSYGLRFIRFDDYSIYGHFERDPRDDYHEFVNEMKMNLLLCGASARIKHAESIKWNIDNVTIHLSSGHCKELPIETVSAIFNKYFYRDPAIIQQCVDVVEKGLTLSIKHEPNESNFK